MTDNEDKLIDLVGRMAQELQELADDAEDAGSSLPSTLALIDDADKLINEITPWQMKMLKDNDNDNDLKASFNGCPIRSLGTKQ